MMQLRKIPLGPFIEILQDLFENGADFIDISGNNDDEGESPKDVIKITVKPEYLSDEEGDDNDKMELQQEIQMDFSDDSDETESTSFSDDDVNDLI
jgi:hypothetical protein